MTKTLYDMDFDAWTQAQVAALRARDWAALDIEHLAEEIEDLRKSERKAVRSHLRMVLSHLLKWTYQPQERDRRGSGWRASIDNGRVLVQDFLEDSPSVRPDPFELAAWAYPRARQDAAQQSGLPLATFPETCPWPLEQVLDPVFLPEA